VGSAFRRRYPVLSDGSRLAAVGVLAASPLVFAAARAGAAFPPCPFRVLTGLECPGCGAGRAVVALAAGDLPAAFDHNLLFVALLPILFVSLLMLAAGRVPLLDRPGWARPLLLLVAGFWVLRLLPFDVLGFLDAGRRV